VSGGSGVSGEEPGGGVGPAGTRRENRTFGLVAFYCYIVSGAGGIYVCKV